MTIYAVGDIQGCLEPLKCLLDQVSFDPSKDQLWSVGDMVNRGPESLNTLRFLKSLGNSFVAVLGNHDLHLLAIAFGATTARKSDTFEEILAARDCDELLNWLRHKPLLHQHGEKLLVHAGIPHIWTTEQALQYASEVETTLRSKDCKHFLKYMYGNEPNRWSNNLKGEERLRVITNYFTRMRICQADGTLDLSFKSTPNNAPKTFAPWFSYYTEFSKQIFFGHWAALESKTYCKTFHALDSGCVWGNDMTLINTENKKRHLCKC